MRGEKKIKMELQLPVKLVFAALLEGAFVFNSHIHTGANLECMNNSDYYTATRCMEMREEMLGE